MHAPRSTAAAVSVAVLLCGGCARIGFQPGSDSGGRGDAAPGADLLAGDTGAVDRAPDQAIRGSGLGWIAHGAAGDIPAPADYDGDGKAELTVCRPGTGKWAIRSSGRGWIAYGTTGDVPVPADYDGDGKAEIAVFRPSTGKWAISGQGWSEYGKNGDIPIPKRPAYPGYPY